MDEQSELLQVVAGGTERKIVDQHIDTVEHKVEEIAELSKLSDNPEYQRLLPRYLEYWKNKPTAEEPYLHGTGSYALRRILREGIRPRQNSAVVTGEGAVLDAGKKDYISLAIPNREGEMVARGYAYASAAEQGLSYNADEHFSEKGRVRRIMDAIGGRKALVSRVLASEIKKEDVGHVEEKRTMLDFEMEILFERALQYGAYVFKPEDARRRIDDLQRVQDGGVIDYDDAHRVLFMNGICRGLGDDFIQARLAEKDEEDSWLKGKIRVAVSDLETRIDSYEQLLAEERDEIEHQFPVVIMLEGKEAGVIDTGMPLLQERVGTQTIKPGAIREIRVPLRNVSTVEGWVVENGLAEVKVTPLEYYEIHEVVESVKK